MAEILNFKGFLMQNEGHKHLSNENRNSPHPIEQLLDLFYDDGLVVAKVDL